jgi:hypothetical protein
MSQITNKLIVGVLLLAGLAMIAGCGSSDPNAKSVFDADTKSHPLNWLPAGHMNSARADIATCEDCHGADLSGGIVKVSCTTCHLGGPTDVHPATFNGVPWSPPGNSHGQYVQANGKKTCQNEFCHGSNLKGVANSGPSCANFVNDNRCHQSIP